GGGDGDRPRIVGRAGTAEVQVDDVDVIGGVAVAVRIDGALDSGDDVRLFSGTAGVENLVREERRFRRDAADFGRVGGDDAGDVGSMSGVVNRIGVVVDEVPTAGDFHSRA